MYYPLRAGGLRARYAQNQSFLTSSAASSRCPMSRERARASRVALVTSSSAEPTPAIWRHELRHVAQYERLGLSFLPLYLWYRAKYGYFDHPLERDASEDPRLFS